MGVEEPERFTYRTVSGQGGRAHQAVCSCGWRSDWMPTAGLAGAMWDDHFAMRHQVRGPHWLVATETVADGYQVTCGCGWESSVDRDPMRLFDEWKAHVMAQDPGIG